MSLFANLAAGAAGLAALGGAAAVGWLAPDPPGDDALTVVRRAPPPAEAGPLARPGAGLAASVARLAVVLPVLGASMAGPSEPAVAVVRRPVQPTPPGPSVTAAAPVHDAGLDFRRQASAIVRLKDQTLAVLLAGGGSHPSRLLRVGEAFDGRWRLAALSMDEAVLGDGATQERVPLFGNPAGGPGRPQGEPQ